MHLKILLPYKVFNETTDVQRIVAETSAGCYGLLPHRLDFAAALVPGIFSYEATTGGIQYVAVDEGVMIKAGLQVLVSVRNAVGGTDLGKLHQLADKEFVNMDKTEKEARNVMEKIEGTLMQQLLKLGEE